MVEERLKLQIDGMHCGACVRRVATALERADLPTVGAVTIGQAEVQASADQASAVIAALAEVGFIARVQE